MRAGVLAMGPLLGKYNRCSTAMSGGCSLGERGIGFHLEGFKKLNCEYKLREGYINISAICILYPCMPVRSHCLPLPLLRLT